MNWVKISFETKKISVLGNLSTTGFFSELVASISGLRNFDTTNNLTSVAYQICGE